jgi:hypothetical protein
LRRACRDYDDAKVRLVYWLNVEVKVKVFCQRSSKRFTEPGRATPLVIVEKDVCLDSFAGEFFQFSHPSSPISSVLSSITRSIFYGTPDPAWLPYETRIAKIHGDKV